MSDVTLAPTPTADAPSPPIEPTSAPARTPTSLTDVIASATSSLLPGGGGKKGGPDLEMREGNPVVNFILGFLLITSSSIANSFGLNLMKYSHIKAQESPIERAKPEYLRPLWLAGITSYILSQLVGSTLALQYLRAEFVAPLGSSSLVFNFLFARWLVGTPVTRKDIQGTLLIVLGVILIIVFSSINSGLSTSLSLDRLYRLWGRGGFLFYFIVQFLALFVAWAVVLSLTRILENRQSEEDEMEPTHSPPHPYLPKFLHPLHATHSRLTLQLSHRLNELTSRSSDARLSFLVGIGWASVGGALAGASLVFTKAVVMVGMGPGGKSVYWRPTPALTLVLLAGAAVGQMVALNRGLKAFDSTLIVPVFYAGYTLLGFLNSMIFLDQTGAYSWPILICIVFSVAVLLSGVVFLSTKKDSSNPPTSGTDPRSSDDLEASLRPQGTGDEPDTPLRPEAPRRKRSRAGEEGRALFSAPEDGDDEDEMDGRAGKFEVGSDEEDDLVEEEKVGGVGRRGSTGSAGPVRRGSTGTVTGGAGSGNVWDEEDGEGSGEGRRGLLS